MGIFTEGKSKEDAKKEVSMECKQLLEAAYSKDFVENNGPLQTLLDTWMESTNAKEPVQLLISKEYLIAVCILMARDLRLYNENDIVFENRQNRTIFGRLYKLTEATSSDKFTRIANLDRIAVKESECRFFPRPVCLKDVEALWRGINKRKDYQNIIIDEYDNIYYSKHHLEKAIELNPKRIICVFDSNIELKEAWVNHEEFNNPVSIIY